VIDSKIQLKHAPAANPTRLITIMRFMDSRTARETR